MGAFDALPGRNPIFTADFSMEFKEGDRSKKMSTIIENDRGVSVSRLLFVGDLCWKSVRQKIELY